MSSKFLEKQETPTWIDQMFDEIDTLEFGAGFEHLQNDAQMQFGATETKGVDAIKKFFVRIDSPLEIKHQALEVWGGDGTKIVRGKATFRKKGSSDAMVTAPFIQIFTTSPEQDDLVTHWLVVAGPLQTDSIL